MPKETSWLGVGKWVPPSERDGMDRTPQGRPKPISLGPPRLLVDALTGGAGTVAGLLGMKADLPGDEAPDFKTRVRRANVGQSQLPWWAYILNTGSKVGVELLGQTKARLEEMRARKFLKNPEAEAFLEGSLKRLSEPTGPLQLYPGRRKRNWATDEEVKKFKLDPWTDRREPPEFRTTPWAIIMQGEKMPGGKRAGDNLPPLGKLMTADKVEKVVPTVWQRLLNYFNGTEKIMDPNVDSSGLLFFGPNITLQDIEEEMAPLSRLKNQILSRQYFDYLDGKDDWNRKFNRRMDNARFTDTGKILKLLPGGKKDPKK